MAGKIIKTLDWQPEVYLGGKCLSCAEEFQEPTSSAFIYEALHTGLCPGCHFKLTDYTGVVAQ